MQVATQSYIYNRKQRNMCVVDACTDSAELHGLSIDDFARSLIDSGIATGRDADRLSLLASDVCAMRAAMV